MPSIRHRPDRAEAGLLSLARGQWLRLALALILTLLSAGVSLILPWALRGLVDSTFQANGRVGLQRLAATLIVVLALQAIANFCCRYAIVTAGERIVANVRRRLFAHLHTLPLQFFDDTKVGDLSSRLSSDAASIRAAVTTTFIALITTTVTLLASAALIIRIDWRLGAIILSVVPTTVVLSRYFSARVRHAARAVQDHIATANGLAEETLGAIRLVIAYTREPHEVRRYSDATERVFDAAKRQAVMESLWWASVNFSFAVSTAVIFWFGGLEVLAGRVTIGALVAALFYTLNVSNGVTALGSTWSVFSSASGASERLFGLLAVRTHIREAPPAHTAVHVRGEIRFEGVTVEYHPSTAVLSKINLTVWPGETMAIVGPSGAGKTTLVNLIPRFLDPSAGRITLDGWDLRELTLSSLRQSIATVAQDVQLLNDTVGNNIRYGKLDASDAEVVDAARAANAEAFIHGLPGGYDTVVGVRGMKLSGGQRQRIAIARAILKNAPVLILDEATSSLDSTSELLVRDALERVMRNRTSIIVAHRLATVRRADRIIVVDGGRIVDEGTHDQLVSRGGLYATLAAGQFVDHVSSNNGARTKYVASAPF